MDIRKKTIPSSTLLKQWKQVCVSEGLFVFSGEVVCEVMCVCVFGGIDCFFSGDWKVVCEVMCVYVQREDAAGKRVEERFPAAGEKGKSHCIEEPKSSRNSNNAFPAWATATTDPWSCYISRERMLENTKKEGRFMLVTSFCTRKKWRRDRKAWRERYSKGVLSELIDLLKAPGQRETDQSHDGSNYVSNGLDPKSNRTPRSLYYQVQVHK